MKKIFAIVLLFFCLSCGDEDFNPEKRFIEKIVILEGKISGFDILTGADMKLRFTSRGEMKETEIFEDVQFLPLTYEDVAFELTDSTFRLQVLDEDEFAPDDIMFDRTFRPYRKTEDGNPFQLVYPDWIIDVHWKTQ